MVLSPHFSGQVARFSQCVHLKCGWNRDKSIEITQVGYILLPSRAEQSNYSTAYTNYEVYDFYDLLFRLVEKLDGVAICGNTVPGWGNTILHFYTCIFPCELKTQVHSAYIFRVNFHLHLFFLQWPSRAAVERGTGQITRQPTLVS